MQIRIIDIRLQDNKGALKGFCDVEINEIIIKDFRILQHPNGKAHVTAPQISFIKGPNGQREFRTLVTVPDASKWELEAAILGEYLKVQGERDGKEAS